MECNLYTYSGYTTLAFKVVLQNVIGSLIKIDDAVSIFMNKIKLFEIWLLY